MAEDTDKQQNTIILDEFGNQIKPFDDSGSHIKVGIYWSVDDVIVGDAVYLHEAESYVINVALDFFEHQELQIEIETDHHYRCAECNRHYVDEVPGNE